MRDMRLGIFILFLLSGFGLFAQEGEVLTAQDAIAIALQNNYDIRLAKNDLKIDEENVSLGNAGILPTVQGTFNQNNNLQYLKQERTDGTIQEQDNAKNNSMNYGVSLGWTVFDGFRMFARYDQLKELEKLGETELKLMVYTRVSDVLNTYYALVQQQQMLKSLDTAIVISKQRVIFSENRFSIGKAAKLEVLNAQVDLNTDQTNYLRQKELYENTKTYLNELLARDLTTKFRVMEEAIIDDKLKLVDLLSVASQQNPQIQIALINKRVAELNLKQVRSARYPQVDLTTGYIFSHSESSLGFARESNSRGLNYGVSASINIFDGFNQNRNERVAKIQIDNSKLQIEQQTQSINSQLTTAFQTYLTNLELVKLEAVNEDIARQNLDITLEKFRIGTITTVEVRAAQLNYINAMARNSTAQYNAKISEITLKELAGNVTF